MTEEMLVREFLVESDLASYSVVIVDQAHERTVYTDVLLALLKTLLVSRKDLRILIFTEILSSLEFCEYFGAESVYMMPGSVYPIDIYHTQSPETDYIQAAVFTVLQIHVSEPSGDILVFFSGLDEIETAQMLIKERLLRYQTQVPDLIIKLFHQDLPLKLQNKAFEPTPEGVRRVILAAGNASEMSISKGRVRYVIDPGYFHLKAHNPWINMEYFVKERISKTRAAYRAGLCGLSGPGKCFRLYTAYEHQELMHDKKPEILEVQLASVLLTLKCIGINDLTSINFITQPPKKALERSLELLFSLNALNRFGALTVTGRKMEEFPVDPMLSKMILASAKHRCSEDAITVAAMLLVKDSIFYVPGVNNVHANKVRSKFYEDGVGDHAGLLKVFLSWRDSNYSTGWCKENFVQVEGMKKAKSIREHLEKIAARVGIELSSTENNFESLRKAIASGYFHQCAKPGKGGGYNSLNNLQNVHVHPSSSLFQTSPRLVIYHEVMLTDKYYVRELTEIKPEWLVEIAPHYCDVNDMIVKKPRGQGRAANVAK